MRDVSERTVQRNWEKAFSCIGKFAQICRFEQSMFTLSPDQWQALSPYLDQALAMTDDARAAWLSSLGEQDPALAAQLGALLDEHRVLAQEGFQERGDSRP
jgi:hypothetical protein